MSPAPRVVTCVVDGRELEPPEPLMRTLKALETLGDGVLELILPREPFPLYGALESQGGWSREVESSPDGTVHIFVRRRRAE